MVFNATFIVSLTAACLALAVSVNRWFLTTRARDGFAAALRERGPEWLVSLHRRLDRLDRDGAPKGRRLELQQIEQELEETLAQLPSTSRDAVESAIFRASLAGRVSYLLCVVDRALIGAAPAKAP